MFIAFDDNEICENEHHDGLVISLTINDCLFKRVLVDGSSYANIFFKSALEDMGLDKKDVTKKSNNVSRFSRETQQTLGDIVLPTYGEGVNL